MNFKPSVVSASTDAPLLREEGNLKYRPDIDGLRAIAVLSVLFFHVGFSNFSGGWVGVDVFFVISGFLITRLIKDQIEAGSFSFAGFYARRARRLFASFVFTVAASFIAGSLIFDRVYLQHFAGEVVYSLVAASNFFYWLDGGYFGVAEQYKPLLHTWSLGVEEQFYLIWPLTILLILRYFRRYLWLLLISASLVSLLLAEYFFYADRARAVFLLLPSRIFEFAIGAMLVWLIKYQGTSQRLLEGALLLGLALILLAVFGFTTSTPFPTVYALVPCLGSALAIFGGVSVNLRWLLGNRLMAGLGRISYSLYLVHWPVIVFYSYHRLAPLNLLEQILICLGSVLAAVLMYTFIEQPFRDPRRIRFSSRAALGFTCSAIVLVLLVPASIVWAKGSLIWRGSVTEVDAAQLQQLEELRKQQEVDDLLRDRPFGDSQGRTKLMFVGDSHSGDVAAAMFLNLGDATYDFARLGFAPGCFSSVDRRPWILRITGRKSVCESQIEALRKSSSLTGTAYLFIADRWTEEEIKGFSEGLALLRSLTKARIVLVGQNATFPTFDDSLRFLDPAQLLRLDGVLFQEQSLVDIRINEQLRNLAAVNGLGFIDRQSLVCSQTSSQCDVRAQDGKFLYTDSNHWSYAGRSVFGQRIVQRFGYLFASTPSLSPVPRP
jgi:peptidoglycan/LPS O-acetylase OafA/YrhL